MTDTDTAHAASSDLASLKLTELRKIAAEKGLKGVSGLRKGDLITAIQTGTVPARARAEAPAEVVTEAPAQAEAPAEPAREEKKDEQQDERPQRRRATRRTQATDEAPEGKPEQADKAAEPAAPAEATEATEAAANVDKKEPQDKSDQQDGSEEPRYESRSAARRARRNRARHNQREQEQGQQDSGQDKQDQQEQSSEQQDSGDNRDQQRGQQNQKQDQNQRGGNRNQRGDNRDNRDNNDGEGRRGRRSRRNRRGRGGDQHDGGQQQEQQHDSADLQDVAGILDIVDNNVAFVRTTGYHAGPADVFVQNQLIRRSGLRAGDAVTGKVTMGNAQTHGQKANQLVSVDTVNGLSVEDARSRPEFSKLTPLYPNQRLRLETEAKVLTTRVIDLIMPIGKGQRALIVSPPKAGKTTILQNIANAISTNNPECHLMVVLVDERPEEVTDMQRSVNGEVIASTFDRPPSEHTAVAELAIERAKRLVEQGKDVVVLLDSITRLGRAYNNSSPASGRILSGGVDSNALYPPKRFLGAARNIENGGSLTIIATAMVETGSAGDTVIFEEFKGTGNAELKLDRKISERRVFPAVDVNPSGTRKDELLLAPEEARIMHKLRRILSALDPQQAIDLLIKQLKKTKSNGEFLMQVASSAPMAADKEEEDYS